LALGRGGLRETVRPKGATATGVWVHEASAQGFAHGLAELRAKRAAGLLGAEVLRQHVTQFAAGVFARHILAALGRHVDLTRLARPAGL
jgi:hypothetical protein